MGDIHGIDGLYKYADCDFQLCTKFELKWKEIYNNIPKLVTWI